MKKEDAMEILGMNRIELRDRIFNNCLNVEELEQVKQKDKEHEKKIILFFKS